MDSTKKTRKGGKRRCNFDNLFVNELPRTANVIDSNSMLHDLPATTKEHMKEYIINRSPGSSEISDILFHIANIQPKQLRTKEICETIESITLIGAKINALLASSNPKRMEHMTIYDLACGHGLAGILLAYRFPNVNVICIDRESRPCWSTYVDAFEKYGEKAKGNDLVLSNLKFQVGDIMKPSTASPFQPKKDDYLICIHGCNELSPFVLQTSIKYQCGYAIMPCCLRENMLGVNTSSSNHNWSMDDTSRYATQVGYLAGKYGCEKIMSISRYITNRFLIIIGDWSSSTAEEKETTTDETLTTETKVKKQKI